MGRGGTPVTGSCDDALAVVAWLFRDDMIRAVCADVDANSQDEFALTDQARADKIAECASDALAVARTEEALICAAEAAGTPIPRRADADPRAVIGLSDALPAPDRG